MRYTYLMVLALVLSGCDFDFGTKKEVHLTEPAEVVDTYHMNSHSDTDISPSYNFSDGSIGMAMHTTTIPEQWGVAFRCKHGKFVSQGSDERHKQLWSKLDRGMKVTVSYNEVYREYKDGRKEFVRLDFLDATPIP